MFSRSIIEGTFVAMAATIHISGDGTVKITPRAVITVATAIGTAITAMATTATATIETATIADTIAETRQPQSSVAWRQGQSSALWRHSRDITDSRDTMAAIDMRTGATADIDPIAHGTTHISPTTAPVVSACRHTDLGRPSQISRPAIVRGFAYRHIECNRWDWRAEATKLRTTFTL